MKEPIEEFSDRQKNCKTVPEYSTNLTSTSSEFNGKYIDVRTIRSKKLYVTRYSFDAKYFDLSLDSNLVVDRIVRISYNIGLNKDGTEYKIFKGDRQIDKNWFIIYIGVNADVKGNN